MRRPAQVFSATFTILGYPHCGVNREGNLAQHSDWKMASAEVVALSVVGSYTIKVG